MSVGSWVWKGRQRIIGTDAVVTNDDVKRLSGSQALGFRGRTYVKMLLLRELAFGPPRRARVPVRATRIELGPRADFPIDWKTFAEIFGHEEYAAPYSQAHVLDVGAHKGYFGAYALANDASVVLSVEPEARNYAALTRTAAPLGSRWLTRNAAIGTTGTTGTLLLDQTSWGHSLVQVARPAGVQQVAIITLEEALKELPVGGSRTIVKIDAEGSECEILASPAPLRRVDLLLVEWHSEKAPCSREELIETVEAAGMRMTSRPTGTLRFTKS